MVKESRLDKRFLQLILLVVLAVTVTIIVDNVLLKNVEDTRSLISLICLAVLLICYLSIRGGVQSAPLFLLIGLALGLIGVEFYFVSLFGANRPEVQRSIFDEECYQKDPLTLYRAIPNSSCQASKHIGSTEIFAQVRYSFGPLGERICTDNDLGEDSVVILGGSYAFGEGLQDADSFACHFGRLLSKRPINFSKGGYGFGEIYQTLKYLQSDGVELNGSPTAYHLMIEDHIWRAVGDRRNIDIQSITSKGLLYRLSDIGAVEAFQISSDPWLHRVSFVTSHLQAYSFAGYHLVPRIPFEIRSPAEAVDIAAALLSESKESFRQIGGGEFVLVRWPRQNVDEELQTLLNQRLAELSIPWIGIPPLPEAAGSATLHPQDGHPSALEAQWVAEELYRQRK